MTTTSCERHGELPQFRRHGDCRTTPDAGVDLVEDQGLVPAGPCQGALEGQKDAGQFAPGGGGGEAARRLTGVRTQQELSRLRAALPQTLPAGPLAQERR